jgi:hypothetical protein
MNEGHLQGDVAAVADNLGANLNQLRRAPSLWHATIQGIKSKQDSGYSHFLPTFLRDYRPLAGSFRWGGPVCVRVLADSHLFRGLHSIFNNDDESYQA